MGRIAPENCLDRPTRWSGRPIESARLVLRAPRPGDADALVELLADPEVARHTARIPRPYTRAEADKFVAACEAERAAGDGVALAIIERASGALLGCIGARLAPGNAELGYWLGREHWCKGYATEAARRLLRLVFEECGVGLVWSGATPDNPASRRVLEKAGLVFARRERPRNPGANDEPELDILTIDRERWQALRAARPRIMAVAVALIDADGRVLLTQRPAGKSMEGLWEFPGGKLEAGESPEAALVRELGEELGIDVSESCLAPVAFVSHDYDTFHLMMPLYACRQWRGAVESREGQKLAWVRPARMEAYPVPPADLPLVASLRDLL